MSEADYVCVSTPARKRRQWSVCAHVEPSWARSSRRGASTRRGTSRWGSFPPTRTSAAPSISTSSSTRLARRAGARMAAPDTTRPLPLHLELPAPTAARGMVFWADKIHKNGCYRWASRCMNACLHRRGAERFRDRGRRAARPSPDETKSAGNTTRRCWSCWPFGRATRTTETATTLRREVYVTAVALKTLARHLTLPRRLGGRTLRIDALHRPLLRALEQDTPRRSAGCTAPSRKLPHPRGSRTWTTLALTARSAGAGWSMCCAPLAAITERPRTYTSARRTLKSALRPAFSLAYAHRRRGKRRRCLPECRHRSPNDERLGRILPFL